MTPLHACLVAMFLALPGSALAQSAGIDMGEMVQNGDQNVEVSSDTLDVNQSDGTALFTGNVEISQGEMRLSAQRVRVFYAEEGGGGIRELHAEGGVTLVNATNAAEARSAVYDLDAEEIVMEGEVLLTQGSTALSADRLTLDLTTGTGQMSGGVRTIFQTGAQ